jgi:hypothetical protein
MTVEDVYGTNLGALKEKTVSQKSEHMAGQITGVPPNILHVYHDITLSMDIMFINKLPFLVMISCGLHFGTVEHLTNQEIQCMAAALKCVINLYQQHGFSITSVHANPKFQPLQMDVHCISFNFCAQGEHVPNVECYIQMIKDRV